MVTIKGAFALDLLLDREWMEYAREHGIENPWIKKRNIRKFLSTAKEDEAEIAVGDKKIIVPCKTYELTEPITTFDQEARRLLPTKDERIAYRRKENLWKGERILPQVSWEEFSLWVEARDGIELVDFLPCQAKNNQCNLFCWKWDECQNEEIKKN